MTAKQPRGKLRIIAGQWRSRLITFPDIDGLRPTSDRIRETVFNWLSPYIEGANGLDLFAGSGALGFEALSRGAKFMTFVDLSPVVIKALRDNAAKLSADNAEFIRGDCPVKMPTLSRAPFDIIFLDPTFKKGLVATTLQYLLENKLLSPSAVIYVEAEKTLQLQTLSSEWQVIREKTTATIRYALLS